MDIQETTPESVSHRLLHIPKPPAQLWLRGVLPPPETKTLAVVGSRALSHYGREACEMLIQGLAGYPISIVSGLALGTDACAHKAALSAKLHTIAVPGSGLSEKVICPRTNSILAKDILASGGALLSEHPPEYKAAPYDFPSRNRIMVGLSDAVLIIEAGEKSGSLITARLAVDYNRDLLCIPHRIGDPHGAGAHQFLRLGATLVTDSSHILEALHIEPRTCEIGLASTGKELNEHESVLCMLLDTTQSQDEIIRAFAAPPHITISLLAGLELRGIVEQRFGGWKKL